MTEKQLERAVLEMARAFGYRCYHTRDSRGSARGFPDLVMARPEPRTRPGTARLIFAELKANNRKPTVPQQEWLALLKATAEAYLWYPTDWINGEIEWVLR